MTMSEQEVRRRYADLCNERSKNEKDNDPNVISFWPSLTEELTSDEIRSLIDDLARRVDADEIRDMKFRLLLCSRHPHAIAFFTWFFDQVEKIHMAEWTPLDDLLIGLRTRDDLRKGH